MKKQRRRRGFERAGTFRPERLGLSARRLRQLRLQLAWHAAAGDVLARRAPARGVCRGVFEVEAPDLRWAETVGALLPRLAGIVAVRLPELRIRRCRVVVASASTSAPAPALPIEPPASTTEEHRAVATPRVRATEAVSPDPGSVERRLRELGRRYCRRASERSRPK